jgi:hypothetical protein
VNASEHGRKMALARWKRHREKPVDPGLLAELASHPPIFEGDAIGSLQWTDFRTGKVTRWPILRGDRVDRVILRHHDGRKTASHGWTWVMDHLRGFLAGRKI